MNYFLLFLTDTSVSQNFFFWNSKSRSSIFSYFGLIRQNWILKQVFVFGLYSMLFAFSKEFVLNIKYIILMKKILFWTTLTYFIFGERCIFIRKSLLINLKAKEKKIKFILQQTNSCKICKAFSLDRKWNNNKNENSPRWKSMTNWYLDLLAKNFWSFLLAHNPVSFVYMFL